MQFRSDSTEMPLGDRTLCIGAIIASVTVLDGFCISVQLFALLVRNGGNLKDLPFISDVFEWQVSQRQSWNVKG